MQKISKKYRSDYDGEDINLIGKYENSNWNYTTEFIDKSSDHKPLNTYAVVIGNGESRLEFDLTYFLPYKTGPLDTSWHNPKGRRNFFTYGCNALYRDFSPDFLIATGEEIIEEVVKSGFCDTNIVYANSWVLPEYPGKFHYIPENPSYNSGTLAAYMAAFDGHKKVFLLGFDGNDTPNVNCNVYNNTNGYPSRDNYTPEDFWVNSLKLVMDTYNDTEFVRVAPYNTFRTPEAWKYCLNFRTIDFRQFVFEADL
jgi:hypothetical protein